MEISGRQFVAFAIVASLAGIVTPGSANGQAKKAEVPKGEKALQWGPAPDAFPADPGQRLVRDGQPALRGAAPEAPQRGARAVDRLRHQMGR